MSQSSYGLGAPGYRCAPTSILKQSSFSCALFQMPQGSYHGPGQWECQSGLLCICFGDITWLGLDCSLNFLRMWPILHQHSPFQSMPTTSYCKDWTDGRGRRAASASLSWNKLQICANLSVTLLLKSRYIRTERSYSSVNKGVEVTQSLQSH